MPCCCRQPLLEQPIEAHFAASPLGKGPLQLTGQGDEGCPPWQKQSVRENATHGWLAPQTELKTPWQARVQEPRRESPRSQKLSLEAQGRPEELRGVTGALDGVPHWKGVKPVPTVALQQEGDP